MPRMGRLQPILIQPIGLQLIILVSLSCLLSQCPSTTAAHIQPSPSTIQLDSNKRLTQQINVEHIQKEASITVDESTALLPPSPTMSNSITVTDTNHRHHFDRTLLNMRPTVFPKTQPQPGSCAASTNRTDCLTCQNVNGSCTESNSCCPKCAWFINNSTCQPVEPCKFEFTSHDGAEGNVHMECLSIFGGILISFARVFSLIIFCTGVIVGLMFCVVVLHEWYKCRQQQHQQLLPPQPPPPPPTVVEEAPPEIQLQTISTAPTQFSGPTQLAEHETTQQPASPSGSPRTH